MNDISPAIFQQDAFYCFHLGTLFDNGGEDDYNLTVEYRPSGRLKGGSITPEQYELFRSLDQGRDLGKLTVDEKGILLSFARQGVVRLVDLAQGYSVLSDTVIRWRDGITLKSQNDEEGLAVFVSVEGTEFTVGFLEILILGGMAQDTPLSTVVERAVSLAEGVEGGRSGMEADIEADEELRGTTVEQFLTGNMLLFLERLRRLNLMTPGHRLGLRRKMVVASRSRKVYGCAKDTTTIRRLKWAYR